MMHDATTPPEPDAMDLDRLDRAARREVLSAYLDDELHPDVARRVTAWLDDHPEALRDVEHLRRVWDLLDGYEDEAVPDDFAGRVLARTVGAPARGSGRALLLASPWRLPAAAAAVLLLGVALGLLIPEPAEPEAPPVNVAIAEQVPVDLIENADVLLELSEEEFRMVLLGDPDPFELPGATSATEQGG